MKTKFRIVAAALLFVFFGGCITTYRDFPRTSIEAPPLPQARGTLYYTVERFPILQVGGYDALQAAFQKNRVFPETVRVNEPPENGIHCLVEVEYKPLSLPALIFGYLSVSTLTFIPMYSGRDGYLVYYHVSVNKRRVKTYQYEVTRKFALWLPLLAFSWVNFATYSESEAFTATAHQFFADALKDNVFESTQGALTPPY